MSGMIHGKSPSGGAVWGSHVYGFPLPNAREDHCGSLRGNEAVDLGPYSTFGETRTAIAAAS